MMGIFYIIILLTASIILYHLLLLVIRNSKINSPFRHLGEALFASMSRFYDRVSSGAQSVYNRLAEKRFNNPLGFFGSLICIISLFFLIIIDISFISLMGAQFWGSDPEQLMTEISTAAKRSIPIEAVTDYFDALLNWAVSHVSIEPFGHFLAANALITIICLVIAGLFIKECAKPTGWLPLNLNIYGRWIIGTLSSLLLLCLFFYYGFLIYYGVSSTVAVEAESTEFINFFEDLNTTSDQSSVNPLESLEGGKLAASVAYATAVLGVNFLAFWGALLFCGIVITLLVFLSRWFLERGYDLIILPLGIAMGYVQVQNREQNITVNQNSGSHQPNNEHNVSINNNDEIQQEQLPDRDLSNNDVSNTTDELQQLRDELEERRIAEEERQRNIQNDPLNLN